MARKRNRLAGKVVDGIRYADPVESRVLRMPASYWQFLEDRKDRSRKTVTAQLRGIVEELLAKEGKGK